MVCKQNDLLFYEQRAINILKPKYNASPFAQHNRIGTVLSPETKAKISASLIGVGLGRKNTLQAIANMTAWQARKVQCIENGLVFESVRKAGEWCKECGLTSNIRADIVIYKSMQRKGTGYKFHWRQL